MKQLLIALAAVALVGGCVKVDRSPPKDLPAYVTVYPGAEQVVSMGMGGISAIAFRAAATPDDVIGYYRTQAASNGLTETTPANANASPDQRQAMFNDPASKRMLAVVARPQGTGSMVSLTYARTAG